MINAAAGLSYPVHIFSSALSQQVLRCIPENVTIHDYVPYEKLYEILTVARFVMIPLHNTYESPGTATVGLSIAFGKAVMATGLQCLEDYVHHQENGIIVKPYDEKGMRDAMVLLYEDKNMCTNMGKKSLSISRQLDGIAEKNLKYMFHSAVMAKQHRDISLPKDKLKVKI